MKSNLEPVSTEEDEKAKEADRERRRAAAKKRAEAEATLAKMRADTNKKARADAARAKQERAVAKIASRKAKAKAARAALVGKTLPTIKTKLGTYTKPKVTEASALELTVFHSNGATSIPYPDLPSDLQKRLHYHKDDYAEAVAASRTETVAKPETKDVSARTSSSNSKGNRAKSNPLPSGEFAREAELVASYKELYNVKKGEFGALKKLLKQKRAKMGDLQKGLRSNFRKLTDEKALLKLQQEYGKLLAKEAVILAETDDAMMRMSLSPFQYREVEPMLDQYQKLLFEWHKLKGNIKIGRDKSYRMSRIADDAVVKSGHKADVAKKLKAQVEDLEVKERVKSGEVAAYREKLFAASERRRNNARKR